MVFLRLAGILPVVVHGGGPQITAMLDRLGHARRVPGRPARHHAGDDRRRPDGAGRPGRPGAGRADQPARPLRRRPLRRGRAACSPRSGAPRWSAASPSTSAWSATSWRSTRTPCSTSLDGGPHPGGLGRRPGHRRHRLQHQRRHAPPPRSPSRWAPRKLVVLTDVEGLYANWPGPATRSISALTADELEPMLPGLEAGMVPKMEACLRAVARRRRPGPRHRRAGAALGAAGGLHHRRRRNDGGSAHDRRALMRRSAGTPR